MVDEAVCAFLRDYIDSFESLEVLLLLRRERTACTAEELRRRLRTHPPLIDDALSSLVRARLVNTDQKVPALHTYAGEDPARDGIVDSLARVYRDEPIKIMQLMTTNAIERLRTSTIRAFADAFVVRKDDGRG
ncbi:MAG TPA: hypothetical protein VMA54_15960 [Steroidobacteraceae bacterium]|nr:hypothetical protein [Steroidobacteraceae bacterium]